MMRYHVSFALADVFFTHFHADHVIGIIGLMRTMDMQGRTEQLRLWGPRGATRVLRRAEQFGFERLDFPVEILELAPDEPVRRNGYQVIPFAVDHRGSASLGYAIVEETR
jgi:ribonuclease Z